MFHSDHLFKYRAFYVTLFSIHHPFTVNEISKYSDVISWGSCTYSIYESSYNQTLFCNVGLNFNKNIAWNTKLRSLDKLSCNHLQAVYYDETELPLSAEKEVYMITDCLMSYFCNNRDPQNKYPELPDIQSWFEKDYSKTITEEVQNYIEDYERGHLYINAVLLSESFYNFVLSQILIRNKKFRVTSFLDLLE